MVLYFREKVDKLDVSREEESPGGDAAQVVLGVEQSQLDRGAAARVSRDQIAELSHDVSANLHHVLMDCLGLQRLNTVLD